MPLESLHRLADDSNLDFVSGDRLTLMNITGRSGSTLICQMLNLVPGVRVISEPWVLDHIHCNYVKYVN